MNKTFTSLEIQAFQQALNANDGAGLTVDGDWGKSTQAAFVKWAKIKPAQAIGGWPYERDMEAFYGPPGTGHTQIVPPYQLYYDGKPVPRITVHEKIATSVQAALRQVLVHYGIEKIRELKLDQYDGCYNNRNKRGGTTKSTHAYAAALDFNAEDNQLRMDHTQARFAKPEYEGWWRAWESVGAVSLGRARDFDWQHVQFARLS